MERSQRVGLVVVAIILAAMSINATPLSAQVRYTVTDLSTIWEVANPTIGEAFTYFIPRSTSLNDQRQLVGAYWLPPEDPGWFGVEYGFVWDPSSGLHEFGCDTCVRAINNQGLAVGSTLSGPFSWDSDNGKQMLPRAEGVVCLRDVNDSGVAVGDGYSTTLQVTTVITWDIENGSHDLGTFGADEAHATEINNQGQILGLATNCQPEKDDTFSYVWDPDTGVHRLGDTEDTQFIAINDLGQVIGSGHRSVPDSDLSLFAHNSLLCWQNGEMTELVTLSNGTLYIGGANNVGEIAGIAYEHSDDSTYEYAFLWSENAGLQDLNDLIAADSPWQITWANDINNRGEIVCQAFDTEGRQRILMLTPVPEPRSLIALLTGIMTLVVQSIVLRTRKVR